MKFTVTLLSILILIIGITASSVWAANLALSLDGRGDYVDVGNSTTLMFSDNFTLECWVKPVGHPTSAWGAFICRDAYPVARNYWFGYDYGPDMVSFRNIGVSEHSPPNVLTVGSWTHYAVTINPDQKIAIYINGKPAMLNSTGAERSDETRRTINVPTNIGASGKRGVDFFSGLIDEVRIWDIARTEEQIRAAMSTTLTGHEDGLAGYWNFDDGTAHDLSPNGNDGILHSDAQIVESPLPDEFIQKEVTNVVLENEVANPDSRFTVNASVFSGEALHSFVFDLTFDPSVLQAVVVKEGSFLSRDGMDATSWQTHIINNENGVISNIRCSRTEKEGVGEKGILATVTFEATDIGSTDLSVQNLRLLSPSGEEMETWVREGSVDVYPHGSISGVVLDSTSKQPVQGVELEVSKGSFTFGFSAYSADDGSYTIDGVPLGDFDVTAMRDDYIPETIPEVRVEQGKDTGDVNINLTSFDTASTITIMTPIAVGESAVDFVLQDIDGNQIIPSDFAGRPIILNFWDSASEHCQRQIPHLDTLHKKYQGDGLVVIGVSKEMANNDALEFARSQMSYVTVLNGTEAFQAYGVTSIPCTYYIDKTGEVRYRDVGFPSGGEAKMEQRISGLIEHK